MWEDLQITNRLLYQLSYVGFLALTDFYVACLYPHLGNSIGTQKGVLHGKNSTTGSR